ARGADASIGSGAGDWSATRNTDGREGEVEEPAKKTQHGKLKLEEEELPATDPGWARRDFSAVCDRAATRPGAKRSGRTPKLRNGARSFACSVGSRLLGTTRDCQVRPR